MKKISNFFDGIVSLESTVKLCEDLWESLHNMHHKVPKELEPRLIDFMPKMHRYRVKSYKISIVGGIIGAAAAAILLTLGDKLGFDAMLISLLCILLGASSGLIVMAYRRQKENMMEKRAMNKYKSALDDYYAKHRVESFVASMKSANIVTACCDSITKTKEETKEILAKMYDIGNIPAESRNFETMCAAYVCAKAMPKVKNVQTVLDKISDVHHEQSEYTKLCAKAKEISSQMCDDLKTDEAYDKLKENVMQLVEDCNSSNEEIKKHFLTEEQ